jgi:hypothetical protein
MTTPVDSNTLLIRDLVRDLVSGFGNCEGRAGADNVSSVRICFAMGLRMGSPMESRIVISDSTYLDFEFVN